MTIKDNRTPREQQIARTVAALDREEGAGRRDRQVTDAQTAFWICGYCRAQNRGSGDGECAECGRVPSARAF